MNSTHERDRRIRWPLQLALLGVALFAVGCMQLGEFLAPPAPHVADRWPTLLEEIRAFERRIGFRETPNFAKLATDRTAFHYCGRTSNRHLPYSYQDERIEWPEIEREELCRAVGADTDVHFGKAEAWGEIGTPITAAMLAGSIDRFVYLVIHEDCHDQFEFPNGIEEPLCDIITHRAMAQFAATAFRWHTVESRAIKNYARTEARRVAVVNRHYEQAQALYARFERGEISHESLLEARAHIYARVEHELNLQAGQLDNIALANYMTYSRHYPALARIAAAWGDDLPGMMEFFRLADARKPSREAWVKRTGAKSERSAAFLQAYERAVLETIQALAGGR